jgi:hypothetical protein
MNKRKNPTNIRLTPEEYQLSDKNKDVFSGWSLVTFALSKIKTEVGLHTAVSLHRFFQRIWLITLGSHPYTARASNVCNTNIFWSARCKVRIRVLFISVMYSIQKILVCARLESRFNVDSKLKKLAFASKYKMRCGEVVDHLFSSVMESAIDHHWCTLFSYQPPSFTPSFTFVPHWEIGPHVWTPNGLSLVAGTVIEMLQLPPVALCWIAQSSLISMSLYSPLNSSFFLSLWLLVSNYSLLCLLTEWLDRNASLWHSLGGFSDDHGMGIGWV